MLNNEKSLIYASKLAKYVISYVFYNAEDQYKRITNLKLQKILYYIEGYFMAKYGYSLYPALIEAWRFGPVLPSVYYEYSIFGADPIVLSEEEMSKAEADFKSSIKDSKQRALINHVIDKKMNMDVWQLVEATHREAPWKDAIAKQDGNESPVIITKRKMMEYFKSLKQ